MGRHAGRRAWNDLSPEEKADAFDAQIAVSSASAERQRAEGSGPYCYDHLIEKKTDEQKR